MARTMVNAKEAWKKIVRRSLAVTAVIATVVTSSLTGNAMKTEAAENYNGQAAAAWAINNYAYQANRRPCTNYVKDVMAAGGIALSSSESCYPNRILEAVQSKGLGTVYNVNSVNASMISPGDIVTWCCDNHGSAAHPLYGLHAGVIADVNTANQTVRYLCTNNKHDTWISLSRLRNMRGADACGSNHLVCQIIHFGGSSDVPSHRTETNPWSYSATPTACYGTLLSRQYWPKVQWIQQAFNIIQNAGLTVDGHYGNSTKKAAIAFQRAHGLRADGVVGPGTANKMAECLHNLGYYEN